MDMTVFVERDLQLFFARIAQTDWWKYRPKGEGQIEFDIDRDKLRRSGATTQKDASLFLKMVDAQRELTGSASLHTTIITLGKLLATGPKLFRVNRETCESLAQVAPEVEIADYQQPYEAMIVEFDREWVQSLGTPPEGVEVPLYCVLWHNKPSGMIVSSLLRSGFDTGLTMIMVVGGRKNTVEKMLHVDGGHFGGYSHEGDTDYSYQLHRVALNYALIATMIGTGSTGWADPKWHAKHQNLKGERGELFRMGDIELMDLTQKIQLCRRERVNGEYQGGDGTYKKPHWRRGHIRSQPHGPKLSKRKLVFIAPMFIHLELMRDDLSGTDVTYD